MGKLFVFIGPSGSGKSTIQHSMTPVLKFLTNYATRSIRQGEINGLHINQVTKDEFIKIKNNGKLFEDTEYNGEFYGSPLSSIEDLLNNNTPYHATLDINGALQMKDKLGEDIVKIIYVKPPSIEVLKERMKQRGDSEEKINSRIEHLHRTNETDNEKYADYIIVNDNLNTAIQDAMKIVIKELTNLIKGEKLNGAANSTT